MSNGKFRLLEAFRRTFLNTVYQHRNSTLGNKIGRELFEDLLHLRVSPLYSEHVRDLSAVVNIGGKIHTPRAIRRNGSGTSHWLRSKDYREVATEADRPGNQ